MKRTDSILQQFYMSRLPKAQMGLAISDGTRVAPRPKALTEAEYQENERARKITKEGTERRNKQILEERQKARNTKGTFKEKNFNIGEKFRMFPGSVGGAGELFDDYINPLKFVGDMASNLGNSRTPQEAALNVAMTAGLGALGFDPLGSGLKSSAFKEARASFPKFIDEVSYSINKPKSVEQITNKNLYKELGSPLNISEGLNNQGVFSLKRFPDHVVKFEPVETVGRGIGYPEYTNFDFVSAMKNIKDKPNIAKVKNQLNVENNKRALIMNRIDDGYRPLDLNPINYRKMPDDSVRKMYYDLKDVINNDLGFDFMGNNYLYNPKTKDFSLFDFSPQFKAGNDGNSQFWINDVLGNTNSNLLGKAQANKNLKTAIISKLVNDHRVAGQNLFKEIGTGYTLRSHADISKLLDKGDKFAFQKFNNALKDVDIYQQGGVIKDDRGQWAHPGKVTRISSPNITMKGVPYPVLGVGSNGEEQMMYPGQEYNFGGASYVDEYPMMKNGGEMIKRKDGSYSKRGLWDNIRANKGSGKKPSKEMLEQERKIKSKEMKYGGTNNSGFEALPEYVQAKILANMGYGGYYNPMMEEGGEPNGGMALGQIMAVSDKMNKLRQFISPDKNLDPWIASKLAVMDDSADAIANYMMYNPEAQGDEEEISQMSRGGYVVSRSSARKGKTHKVTGPDGTVKYFGDSKLGQHPDDPERKKAFYARHKKNLDSNPYFRAFAKETWQQGGQPGLSFWNASKTPQGAVTPTGMSNYFNDNKQGFDQANFTKKMQELNLDTSSNVSLQQDMMKKYPDLVNQVMSEYGDTNAGRFDDGIIGARVINAASKIPTQTKQVPPQIQQSMAPPPATYKNPNAGYVVNVRGDDNDGAYYFPSSENFDKLSSAIPGGKEYRDGYKGATVNMTNANFMKQYGNNYKEALGQAYKRNPQNPEQYIPMQRNGGSTWSGNNWYQNGGLVNGAEMEVTPEQAEMLRQQGYEFEII